MSCIDGFKLSNNWHDPIGGMMGLEWVQRWYVKYPLASRATMIPTNTVFGLVKPFLLPITATVGVIVKPIIALFQYFHRGDKIEAARWAKAACFSLLALGGVAGFMMLSAYHMTLMQGTAVVVAGCSLSVIIHVARVSDADKPQ